jgi:CheY-like chemotaxis protein
VLIIEDDPDSAESTKRLLELHGHTASVAQTGKAGIDEAARSHFDAVICDVGLPGLDGYTVAARLRDLPCTPPRIIAVTGYRFRDGDGDERESLFDHYLVKPVELATLLAAVAGEEEPVQRSSTGV